MDARCSRSRKGRGTADSSVCSDKGIYNQRKDKHGDLIVEVSVTAPKAQDERSREILRELAQLHPEDPREEMWSKV